MRHLSLVLAPRLAVQFMVPVILAGCLDFSSSASSEPDADEVIQTTCSVQQLAEDETTVTTAFDGRRAVSNGTPCGDVEIGQFYTWKVPAPGVYRIRVESTGPVTLGMGLYRRRACFNFDSCVEGGTGTSLHGVGDSIGGAGGVAGETEVFVATMMTEPLDASTGYYTYIAVGCPDYETVQQNLPYVLTIERVATE